jgi:Radical SAM superfamily
MFCPVYKNRKFSLRSIVEIKQDILAAKQISDDIRSLSKQMGFSGTVNDKVVSAVFNDTQYHDNHRSIAAWLYYDTRACFLQDADNLVLATDDLVEILEFLRKTFPGIKRVTTYSRSRTLIRKSVASLKKIHQAGLDRIHIGLETGYDPLLKLMKKGVSAAQQIEAGRSVIAAGMSLSEYVMPGLGGQEMWREHALETARVLNQIDPHFIRLRSLRVPKRIPLYENMVQGTFTQQTDDMLAEEIRLLIESLEGIHSTVTSDHIMNLLAEVSGKLPHDKESMLDVISRYQALSHQDRLIFRTGRRGGTYAGIDDLQNDPATYHKIENLMADIRAKEGKEGLESFITGLADRYI